uniref:Uncharacterized protein n=1 Tax=Oryza nivara TaxID=4536 RepID=A0A0E0J4N7_ORYNI
MGSRPGPQTAFKIEEMIELCEFYANMSNSKRNTIPAKMLKNAQSQEDFGVLDLIDQAQKDNVCWDVFVLQVTNSG